MSEEVYATLILTRHGESDWNKKNLFTGWVDVPLAESGIEEAKKAGAILKEAGYKFDYCFTSVLRRAIKTLWYILDGTDQLYVPVQNTWRLNERHYGGLQGLNKVETVEKYGAEKVQEWRRSYDIPPPPVDPEHELYPCIDRRYADVDINELPKGESLQLTEKRVLPFWESDILPKLKEGKTVLIAAHGNSLRALVKQFDGISTDAIAKLNIPTGVPLVYQFDKDMNIIPNEEGIEPLRGKYLGDRDEILAKISAVANQTKKKE